MGSAARHVTLGAVLLAALCVSTGSGAEDRNSEQDQRMQALAGRVARLEALIGPDERPVPGKPALAERLDRLERELRDREGPARPSTEDLRESLRQIGQTLQTTNRQVEELASRMDRAERQADRAGGADGLRDLRRDVDQLQRQLDDVRQKLGRAK